jgi:hypothetical protein
MPGAEPPAYAWDWLARHHLVWREVRDRLVSSGPGTIPAAPGAAPGPAVTARRRMSDVPDWSHDHRDLVQKGVDRNDPTPGPPPRPLRDYLPLDTRTEVIAALRNDYPDDGVVRAVVDAVVTEVAFLGRLDVPLHALGVRSAPRGMRWWWSRLSGVTVDDMPSATEIASELAQVAPLQLRLLDVLAGFGDD